MPRPMGSVNKSKVGEDTDLKFLWEMFPRNQKVWTEQNFRKLVKFLKDGKKAKYISTQIGVAESGVCNVIQELKRAAKKGFTLEQYVKAGRPCQYGKKVLA